MLKNLKSIFTNRNTVLLLTVFTVLFFALDSIPWLVLFKYEDIFYPLIFGSDWYNIEIDALYDLLDIDEYYNKFINWSNRFDYMVNISQLIGLGMWMIIPHARSISGKKIRELCFGISACAAALFTVGIYFTVEFPAMICIVGAMFFTASALGLLLWRLTDIISSNMAGLFLVLGIVISTLVLDLAVRPYFWESVPLSVLCILIVLLLMLVSFIDRRLLSLITDVRGKTIDNNEHINEPASARDLSTLSSSTMPIMPMPRFFILNLLAVILMVFVISNVARDPLFAFIDAYWEIPDFGFYLILFVYPVYIFAGYLFDKGIHIHGFLIGALCIGINLAIVLFFEQAQLFGVVWISAVYNIIRTFGNNTLFVFCLAAPIYYTIKGWRYIPPQTGFFMYALCSFAVPYIFDTTRSEYNVITIFDEQLSVALGIALLLTFGTLALIFILFRSQDRHERNITIAAVRAGMGDGGSDGKQPAPAGGSDIRQKLIAAAIEPLTPRELEVAELTVLGIKRKIIADTLFIQSSTVDSHRISIYNKFGVRTRSELLEVLER